MINEKYSIFHIEGGIGKHIAATAVAKCIKNTHPDRKLIIVCAHPIIFLNLKFVDRVYRIGNTPYFYQDYINKKDFLLFKHEPYFTTEHIKGELDLIKNWCNLYNLKYTNEKPELVLNSREKQISSKLWNSDKPILLLHTSGGVLDKQNDIPYKWTRDMPPIVAQSVIEEFKNDYSIFQVTKPSGIKYDNVTVVDKKYSFLELSTILFFSKKRLLIDSSLQHAANAFNIPSVVLWIGTNPNLFGYKIHDNIIANKIKNQKLPDSYLFDYNFEGLIHECPYENENEIFNIDKIINSLKKQ